MNSIIPIANPRPTVHLETRENHKPLDSTEGNERSIVRTLTTNSCSLLLDKRYRVVARGCSLDLVVAVLPRAVNVMSDE